MQGLLALLRALANSLGASCMLVDNVALECPRHRHTCACRLAAKIPASDGGEAQS